jgi:Domain of unknown function (DUF1854)
METIALGGRQDEQQKDRVAGGGRLLLERRQDGRLWARARGVERVVHVRRCFPWTEPGRFVSLRDEDGEEFALVADPGELDGPSRGALDAALAEGGFVFDVAGVLEIEEEVELRHWRVRTRQGDRSFQTRLDEWPRTLPDGGLLIRDLTGDLYRLAHPDALDRTSRALLWAFVD